MAELSNASMLFLDDKKDNLDEAQRKFLVEGFNLQITKSIDEAKKKALGKELDIFICDLRLDDISRTENGKSVVRYIRERNKDIFLAIYTAFQKELSNEDIKILRKNDIEIYDKASTEEFLLNLQNDFRDFKKNKISKESNPSDLLNKIKLDVLNHLRNVSNQNLNVPIPGIEDISIKDLIQEVECDSEIGKKYMTEWYNTLVVIQQLRTVK